MIYLTGDTHIPIDKLSYKSFPEQPIPRHVQPRSAAGIKIKRPAIQIPRELVSRVGWNAQRFFFILPENISQSM